MKNKVVKISAIVAAVVAVVVTAFVGFTWWCTNEDTFDFDGE